MKRLEVGEKYGRITIVEVFRKRDSKGKSRRYVRGVCECGTKKEIRLTSLMTGRTVSCGCYQKSMARIFGAMHKTHGGSGTRLFARWRNILGRCFNPDSRDYQWYGARGIKVCDRWHDFKLFRKDIKKMGFRNDLEIDRIDNDKDYEPSNVRLATRKEQMNNTSRNAYIEWNGETKTISQWAEQSGITPSKLGLRLKRGMPFEKAIIGRDLRKERGDAILGR